ncbi:MAG: phage holin family protein [Patescibacteria group bacterium]|nr:phage holin family protein [Patescibacteria group bacterium]
MRWISRGVAHIIVNIVAILAASTYIHGFFLTGDFTSLVEIAAILTLLNILIRPILNLLFGPIIVITLGIGFIVVNTIILTLLDMLSKNLTIESVPSLVYATLLIGVINTVTSIGLK